MNNHILMAMQPDIDEELFDVREHPYYKGSVSIRLETVLDDNELFFEITDDNIVIDVYINTVKIDADFRNVIGFGHQTDVANWEFTVQLSDANCIATIQKITSTYMNSLLGARIRS